MHITIIAFGSQGDVQPMVALGVGLARAGHRVRLVTFESFAGLVTKAGLDFHPVKGDAQAIVGGMGVADIGSNPLKLMRSIMQSFGRIVDDFIEAFSAPELLQTDCIINQLPGGVFGADLAEKAGVPQLMAAVIPLTLTRAFPFPFFPQISLSPFTNRLTYRAGSTLFWRAFYPAVKRFRGRLALSSAAYRTVAARAEAERTPVINGFSPRVIPRPPDWGPHIHITGWWTLDEPDWTPPAELVRFLDAGDPPVFVGFGSMPIPNPATLAQIILDAFRLAGVRGVLSAGWAGLKSESLPETVFPVGYTPYPWLFPRMAAVVHHGGSGTTGLAARAGVPVLVVPFGGDQFFWGLRMATLGVAPRPISIRKLDADNLAAAIQRMRTDSAMRQKAAALGEAIRAEDGIGNAIRLIENLIHR